MGTLLKRTAIVLFSALFMMLSVSCDALLMAIIEAGGGTYQDGSKEHPILVSPGVILDELSVTALSSTLGDYDGPVTIYYKLCIPAATDYELVFSGHRVPDLSFDSGVLTTEDGQACPNPISCTSDFSNAIHYSVCFMSGLEDKTYLLKITTSFLHSWDFTMKLEEAIPYNEGSSVNPVAIDLGVTRTLKAGWDIFAHSFYTFTIPSTGNYEFILENPQGQDSDYLWFYLGTKASYQNPEYFWYSWEFSGIRNLAAGTYYLRVRNNGHLPKQCYFTIGAPR